MQLSARGAQRTRDESKKLSMYSKQWLPGDTLRVFYPLFWVDGKPEIAVGAVWGHSVNDIKLLGLKTAFIPSTTQFDENAVPIGPPDITYQFSKIAKLFVNGQKLMEEEAIAKKNWKTEALRKEALKQLEAKYDTKNNQQAVKPIIDKAKYYITTEVVSIKVVNTPVADSITVTSCPLSSQTITRLYALLDDPKYAPNEGDEFYEVEWKYPAGDNKTESGRKAVPSGLTREYRMETQYPEIYSNVSSRFPTVAKNAETIIRRATRAVDPVKVRQALLQYSFLSSEYLDCIDDEDVDTLLQNIQLVKELDIVQALTNEKLTERINTAIAEMEANREDAEMPKTDKGTGLPDPADAFPADASPLPDVTQTMGTMPDATAITPTPAPAPTTTVPTPMMPTLEVPAQEVPNVQVPEPSAAAPNIQTLLNNPLNAGTDDTTIADVDFGSDMI